ncbi:hypothetical protein SCP_3200070 [Sparassis crispa]|uniref:Uncharacterized protein n=1 Tax=Sparassis crispa TaxID=139825 RepID=A0A401H023_9APHY|nr:hypothetical protein SCP_1104560 [Sparassis crispa]XP_027618688.1 hypothetical protein SCP_1104600 [Sparassis crispa]XP_027618689.1 hypothetical protein SCP_1104640 [Sparassis crispa]XP_027621195.1 hypothetical protein SCP_2800020 [Sparassis crispa]XP_027621196.1 hypothetical protein SCP_2800060 [Sparassis crispa]XP_027621197.1 hypothetical protein SCP_2800100 [Sparassis crispa]XP_027621198.1 hypothetical protein SCP_3200070 [Sparassis crispa]GBE87774.1 hypothetical protein SCP_1104560 [S
MGNPVKIPEPGCGFCSGNANELGDVGGGPGKSYLFSLTVYDPEIGSPGDRVTWLVELDGFVGSGASSTALENPRERINFTLGRTHNRSRSPR